MFSIDIVASTPDDIFADSKIALLCHALRICIAHVTTESCPFLSCLDIELFELVIDNKRVPKDF